MLDGYPRSVEQAKLFEKQISPVQFVLYLEASDSTMRTRLSLRGKTSGRADDSGPAVDKQIEVFRLKKFTLETGGKDGYLHSKRVEKM